MIVRTVDYYYKDQVHALLGGCQLYEVNARTLLFKFVMLKPWLAV